MFSFTNYFVSPEDLGLDTEFVRLTVDRQQEYNETLPQSSP